MSATINPDLLEILRDPLAVQEKEKYGEDPGKLELVHDCWLVSQDTGLKYPIKDGIPVMLIEEGKKWQDTPIDQLPVPPPPLVPDAGDTPQPVSTPDHQVDYSDSGPSKLVYIGVAILLLLVFIKTVKYLRGDHKTA